MPQNRQLGDVTGQNKNKDITNLQKEVIVLGGSKGHNIEEAAEFTGVSHSTVKRAFRQWNTSDIRSACKLWLKKILTYGERRKLSCQVLVNRRATRRPLL